jgi:hypothetical protein
MKYTGENGRFLMILTTGCTLRENNCLAESYYIKLTSNVGHQVVHIGGHIFAIIHHRLVKRVIQGQKRLAYNGES